MFKTIAFAAVRTLIAAATPAVAGPGIVIQGRSLSGIEFQGVSRDEVKPQSATQHQTAARPDTQLQAAMSSKLPPVDVELAGKPVQTACISGCSGIKFNGLTLNGLTLNGLTWNGITFNGLTLNGAKLNGWSLNGAKLNGMVLNGMVLNGAAKGSKQTADRDATLTINAVTLRGGKRIVIR